MPKAQIIIYNRETGDIVEEIDTAFWFSFAAKRPEDKHFNVGLDSLRELKTDEDQYIKISLDDVLAEIKRVMV
jgi:hypothetical protein